MLFNSYEFVLVFLPVVLVVFYTIVHTRFRRYAVPWVVVSSLFYYGWWNPRYLVLIGASIGVNYLFGRYLSTHRRKGRSMRVHLAAGIALNLGLLGYYKYLGFFARNITAVTGVSLSVGEIVLPLAISFFTFQQIAYLVDAYQGETHEYNFVHYCLFVTFFPQLIAGPIVHHKEMLPQFEQEETFQFAWEKIAVGGTIFAIGLFKKVVIADTLSVYANPVFDAAAAGSALTGVEAWGGALAYTFQLYFDFSGYSDMAIGIARMFGIKLPLNFNSPYKAKSIIEFWRRWHMTLSRFLRDYLYIPLGGNRRGKFNRHRNLLITMILGGLWHGAGWTFVVWGALHGVYLVINHIWHRVYSSVVVLQRVPRSISTPAAHVITLLAVIVGWVFFRATTFRAAAEVLSGMVGTNGFAITAHQARLVSIVPGMEWFLGVIGIDVLPRGEGLAFFEGSKQIAVIGLAGVIAFAFPNTEEFVRSFQPVIPEQQHLLSQPRWISWSPRWWWATVVGIALAWSLLSMNQIQEFLYFQF